MKQTESEKLVQLANLHYRKKNRARIKKNDPHMRFVRGQGVIFSSSSGLDFSGIKSDGHYVSFEVKETQRNSLHMQQISTVQLDTIEEETELKADTFLLVLFSKLNEWYRIGWYELNELLTFGATSIPLRYFRAFGMIVPAPRGFPEYLSAESYPTRNTLRKDFPEWLPTKRRQRKIVRSEPVNYRDPDLRKKRIDRAMERGIRSALEREERDQAYKLK